MSQHLVVRHAQSQPPFIQDMAAQQATAWEAIKTELALLLPGTPTAEQTLRTAANLLASITTNYSPIHGWTLSQRHLLHREAVRLLGAGQTAVNRTTWTEDF